MFTENEDRIQAWEDCQNYMEGKAIQAIKDHNYKLARSYLNDAQRAKQRIQYLKK